MANFFLTSYLKTHIKDEQNNRISIPLDNENNILTNIKKYLNGNKRIVYVANHPGFLEENDIKAKTTFESFDKTGIFFEEKFILDNRNKEKAQEIISKANLVILNGGKCLCQNNFFKEINLKDIFANFNGLVIGISAGTMNLCETIANFPEDLIDLEEPRWLKGLGFCKHIIIPHFDGETKTYQSSHNEINILDDYIYPLSNEKEFIALPNGSYILIDNNKNLSFWGNVYKISNSIVTKIN